MEFELDMGDFHPRQFSMLQEGLRLGAGNPSSEDDFSKLVWLALLDAIGLAGLGKNLKLLNEASLSSSLRANFSARPHGIPSWCD